jgi:phosphoesterase RecJ-like protein
MIEYKNLDFIKSRIEKNNKFIITTHQNPDGDAIGSSLGLHYFLKKLGKESKVINYNESPKYLNYLDPNSEISVFDIQKHSQQFNEAEIIFVLDLNNSKRLVDIGEFISNLNKEIIVIDHHIAPEEFATYYYVNTEVASTCELIWELLKKFDTDYSLETAKSLYTGIVTDTGSFGFDRTTANTHIIAADLINHGVKVNEISEYIYNSSTIQSIHLYGDALKSIELYFDERIAIMTITQEMLQKANMTDNELDGFSTAPLRIESVKAAITIVELKETNAFKLSFRAKKGYGIRDIATKFGGGGHELASGARVKNQTLNELKSKLIKEIEYKFGD